MNTIIAIYPYKYEGLWVFDDKNTELVQEPFISGADTIIDRALERKGISNGDQGFRLLFSSSQFHGYDLKFTWVREGDGGNWYYSEDLKMEGWLCPALLKYFDSSPQEIYARFEEKPTYSSE